MSISETTMTELFEKMNHDESVEMRMFNKLFCEKNNLNFADYDNEEFDDDEEE